LNLQTQCYTTKKHAWDKLLPITGDLEKDFQAVLNLLNEHAVASHKYSIKTRDVATGIIRRDHQKVIMNQSVGVTFAEYIETGEIFLINAWVVTR
jgi:hypothetical protein